MSKKSQPQVICWQAAYSSKVLVSGQRIIRSCRQRKLPQKISRGYETTEKIFNERSLHNDASSFASRVSRTQQAGETEQGLVLATNSHKKTFQLHIHNMSSWMTKPSKVFKKFNRKYNHLQEANIND